jgi:hypothetical protein
MFAELPGSAKAFYNSIMVESLNALKLNTFFDNFDAARVSLYHKPNDLFEIVAFVKENFPFYSMYIDHYTIHGEETVLYCKP